MISKALLAAGIELVDNPARCDVALINHDNSAVPAAVETGRTAKAAGARVLIYPDGGGVSLVTAWDERWEVGDFVDGMLVSAPGKVEVCRRYGYPRPVHAIGWTLSEVVERKAPTPLVSTVLFAPSHPPCLDRALEVNQRLFLELVALGEAGDLDHLVVRHLGGWEENGLPPLPISDSFKISVEEGTWDDFGRQVALIDSSDVVVVADAGTFATLSIARGRAVVTCDSDRTDLIDFARGRPGAHHEQYDELIRYPFDASSDELATLIKSAASDFRLQAEWAAAFVGSDLDGSRLAEIVLHQEVSH